MTPTECLHSLRSFQNNKSPGNDGLTVEFYTAFWESLGEPLVDCLNYSFDHGELSNSQKQAIITLIEKKDKDKRVLNNGFSTGSFEIQRGVRQGDPLSPYLFIIILEVLAISIRENDDIQGIVVDGVEIKIEVFADDLTAFLRNDRSLKYFFDVI